MAKLEIEKDRTISDEDLQNILEEPAAHPAPTTRNRTSSTRTTTTTTRNRTRNT